MSHFAKGPGCVGNQQFPVGLIGIFHAEPEHVGAMADYLRAAAEALSRWNPAETGGPGPEFGPPPVPSASKRDLRSAG